MSVEKQILSLCKFHSFYEKIPEEILDETDVDSYFYHNIFDVSQSQQWKVRVTRGSNKKSFAIKLFQLCDLKTQQRYILQEEANISKRELTCLVESLRDFPNSWSSYQVHTDFPTEAQIWDWIYKVERQSLCSSL